MIRGLPVTFVNAQAMALQIGVPIVLYICESFAFSLSMFLNIELVILTWTVP